MENENTNTATKTTQTPAVGGVGRSSLASAIFRAATGQKDQQSADESAENSGATSLDESEATALAGTLAGDETTGQTGGSEDENNETVDAWDIGGTQYTQDQILTAVREMEKNQRLNQSVEPLITTINDYGQKVERFQTLAITECEKTITELNRALTSGKLDSRQYQAAHQQLNQAQAKMTLLEQAAAEEKEGRAKSLQQARKLNAQQTVMKLTKNGWTREQLTAVDGFAQTIMSRDQFADTLNPALFEVLRDAMEYRKARDTTAQRLADKAKTAIRTPSKAPAARTTQTGKKTLGSLVWGGK